VQRALYSMKRALHSRWVATGQHQLHTLTAPLHLALDIIHYTTTPCTWTTSPHFTQSPPYNAYSAELWEIVPDRQWAPSETWLRVCCWWEAGALRRVWTVGAQTHFFFESQLVADLTVENECVELIFETVWLLAQVCRVAPYTPRATLHTENILTPYTRICAPYKPRISENIRTVPYGTNTLLFYCSRIHRTLSLHCAHQQHCRCTVPFYCTWIHRTLFCCSRIQRTFRHPIHTCWCTNWTCSSNVTALVRWRSVLYTSVRHSSQNHSDSISRKSALWIFFFCARIWFTCRMWPHSYVGHQYLTVDIDGQHVWGCYD